LAAGESAGDAPSSAAASCYESVGAARRPDNDEKHGRKSRKKKTADEERQALLARLVQLNGAAYDPEDGAPLPELPGKGEAWGWRLWPMFLFDMLGAPMYYHVTTKKKGLLILASGRLDRLLSERDKAGVPRYHRQSVWVSPNFLWAARHTKKRRYREANGGRHHTEPGDYMVFFFPQASMQANLVHRFTYCGMPHNCPFLYATHRSGERWGVDVPLVIPSANGLPGVVGYASFRM